MFKTLIIPGLCAFAAFAQTPGTKIADERSGAMGITAVLAGPVAAIPGAPYSAQAVTQRVQVLADGNRITQTTSNAVARDTQGRVYREESLPGSATGTTDAPHKVLIEDPVAGLHIVLDSTTKTAYKTSAGDRKKADEQSFAMLQSKDAKSTTTDLGTQTIEGVTAKGTKITHTIPAGIVGNDMPIVITTETWFSPDLKVLVMSKSNDPRMGETTYKLTGLVRAEPDSSLFHIPVDYTVKDDFLVKNTDK